MQPGTWRCSAASRQGRRVPEAPEGELSCCSVHADGAGRSDTYLEKNPGHVVVLLRCILLPPHRISSACFFVQVPNLDGPACDIPLGPVVCGSIHLHVLREPALRP
ncbi:hypothetical protein CGRA01v4_07526 [Colletotrichum graminicola]|nr:hypothetical protein CGRA01v4_07526 [Colletotrichum graminicola]